MNRVRNYHRIVFALCSGVAVAVWTGQSVAYDSAGPSLSTLTPSVASYPITWPAVSSFPAAAWDPFTYYQGNPDGGAGFWVNSGQAYAYSINHLHNGGVVGDGSDDSLATGIYLCPRGSVLDASVLDVSDAGAGCVPVSRATIQAISQQGGSTVGWVQVRKRWDTEPTPAQRYFQAPEHMEIVLAALQVAGLAGLPLFTTRFWMRYPAPDNFVATLTSPDPASSDGGVPLVTANAYVAPSMLPTSFQQMQTHAIRAVFLPELAQLPDVSSSVWDWAAGNELCPITGFSDGVEFSAFSGDTPGQSTAAENDAGTVLPFDVNACHDFARVMGAVNSSHFLPSARGFYDWYHQLAISRMRSCQALKPLLSDPYFYAQQSVDGGPLAGGQLTVGGTPQMPNVYLQSSVPFSQWFTDAGAVNSGSSEAGIADGGAGSGDAAAYALWWEQPGAWFGPVAAMSASPYPAYAAPYDTEAHDCEREAMVYEMVAQHYLQDAWSTGHMWARWGYPNLADFPATLGPDDEIGDARNTFARRFVLAGLTAGFAGMIHGAEAVTDVLINGVPIVSSLIPSPVLQSWIADPLSGPSFVAPNGQLTSVTWVDEAVDAGSAPLSYHGVGDLFWNPPSSWLAATDSEGDPGSLVTGAVGGPYEVEYKKMIGCSAHSLANVYASGNRAFGAASAPSMMLDSTNDPGADACWNHWASNQSMYGALDPLRLDSNSAMAEFVWGMSNSQVINLRVSQVQFVDADDESGFLQFLRMRVVEDSERILMTALGNAMMNPNGTETAKMNTADGRIDFLGIPPNTFVGGSTNGQTLVVDSGVVNAGAASDDGGLAADAEGAVIPSIPYMFTPTGAGVPPVAFADRGAPPDGSAPDPSYAMMTNMFWKAHIAEQCQSPQDVPTLRERCLSATKNGGDPEACTACVERAEIFIPACYQQLTPYVSAEQTQHATQEDGGFLVVSEIGVLTPIMGQSKCQILDPNTPTTGLPASWFDIQARDDWFYMTQGLLGQRTSNQMTASCTAPPYYEAVLYCTGATPYPWTWGSVGLGEYPLTFQMPVSDAGEITIPAAINGGNGLDVLGEGLDNADYTTLMRGVGASYTPGVIGGLGPIIAVEDYQFTQNVDGPFNVITTSLDSAAQRIIGGKPLYPTDGGPPLLTNFEGDDQLAQRGVDVLNPQFCGLTQRMSVQNASCGAATAGSAGTCVSPLFTGTCYNQQTGAGAWSYSQAGVPSMCAIREPWAITGCADGTTCSSSGICRAGATSGTPVPVPRMIFDK